MKTDGALCVREYLLDHLEFGKVTVSQPQGWSCPCEPRRTSVDLLESFCESEGPQSRIADPNRLGRDRAPGI